MAVIIIEGVIATGKTALIRAIEQSALWRERPTKVVLSEHYTERVLELTSPNIPDRQALLTEHLCLIRQLHRRWANSRFRDSRAVEPLVVIERFHLTHAAQVGNFAPFRDIDEALCELGGMLVLLHHPPELLLKSIMATIPARPPMFAKWLGSLGNEQEIEAYFSRLQDSCLAFYGQSCLRKQQYLAYSLTPAQLADAVFGSDLRDLS